LHFKINRITALVSFALKHIRQHPSSIFGSTEWPRDHLDFNNNKLCYQGT